jgi:prophage maintenance system killer protein
MLESLVNNHAFVDGNKRVGFRRGSHVSAVERI